MFQTSDYNNMAQRGTAKWGDNQEPPKRFSIPNAYKNVDNDLEEHYNQIIADSYLDESEHIDENLNNQALDKIIAQSTNRPKSNSKSSVGIEFQGNNSESMSKEDPSSKTVSSVHTKSAI